MRDEAAANRTNLEYVSVGLAFRYSKATGSPWVSKYGPPPAEIQPMVLQVGSALLREAGTTQQRRDVACD